MDIYRQQASSAIVNESTFSPILIFDFTSLWANFKPAESEEIA